MKSRSQTQKESFERASERARKMRLRLQGLNVISSASRTTILPFAKFILSIFSFEGFATNLQNAKQTKSWLPTYLALVTSLNGEIIHRIDFVFCGGSINNQFLHEKQSQKYFWWFTFSSCNRLQRICRATLWTLDVNRTLSSFAESRDRKCFVLVSHERRTPDWREKSQCECLSGNRRHVTQNKISMRASRKIPLSNWEWPEGSPR